MNDLLIVPVCVLSLCLCVFIGSYISDMSYKKAIVKSFPEAKNGYRLIRMALEVYDYLYVGNKVYSVIFSTFPYKIVFVKELYSDDLERMEKDVREHLWRAESRKRREM